MTSRISTLGSYFSLQQRLGGLTAAPAPAPAANVQAPVVSGPDALTLASASTTGVTLDQLEGSGSGETLPTTLDPVSVAPVGAGGPSRTLRMGDSGGDVAALQRGLAAAGFNPGAVDGVMGDRTVAALRAFQQSRGLQIDGQAGPAVRAALGGTRTSYAAADYAGTQTATPRARGVQSRLINNLSNRYKGAVHQCFRYAWTMATSSGGKGIGSAQQSHAGRNQPVGSLDSLIASGQVRMGDVIYVNRRPGADPSSTNLAYGPHWFVYIGNNKFADQYGVRNAQAMANFVPGRRIDTIYHPFATDAGVAYA